MAELSTPNEGGHVTDLAAELALGILPEEEAESVRLHLRSCPACAAEVASLAPVADRLLELVPGTEPPLGFDRRVLENVTPSPLRRLRSLHPSPRQTIASVAAAAAIVFGTMGWMAGRGTTHHPVRTAAQFVVNGHEIGEVETYGHPSWLTVSVHGLDATGPVICQVVNKDGTVSTMGSFDLVKGSGSWSTPDPAGLSHAAEARLVDASGDVVAIARF